MVEQYKLSSTLYVSLSSNKTNPLELPSEKRPPLLVRQKRRSRLGVKRGTSVVLSFGDGLSNSKDILESVLDLHEQSIHQADKQRL